jgi:hypothetical protein
VPALLSGRRSRHRRPERLISVQRVNRFLHPARRRRGSLSIADAVDNTPEDNCTGRGALSVGMDIHPFTEAGVPPEQWGLAPSEPVRKRESIR